MTNLAPCADDWGLLLSRFVDSELEAADKARVESHLSGCPSCRTLLAVFQRNESVLANGLAGEAFGAQTVDAVMTRLRELEGPTIVAPAVEESSPSPWKSWKTWSGAAAAVLLAGLTGLAMGRSGTDPAELGRLRGEIAEARKAAADAQMSGQQTVAALEDRVRDMTVEMRDLVARSALQASPDKTGLAYLNERAIVTQANFSAAKFRSFTALRLREGAKDWEELKSGLTSAYYRDTDVEPGVLYQYKFRAYFSDRPEYTDSIPAQERLPMGGGKDPTSCVRVRFVAALPDGSQATFRVERYVAHKWIGRTYQVLRGQSIGRKEVLPEGEVDLSTRYELDAVVAGQETIVGSLGTGSGPRVLASWPNKQARLKLAKPGHDDEPMVSIWRDREAFLPAAK